MRIDPAEIEALFDAIPSVLFFAKDAQGRYTHVNKTMMQRLGVKSRGEVIGKRADELYPAGMSEAYVAQDARVLGGEVRPGFQTPAGLFGAGFAETIADTTITDLQP